MEVFNRYYWLELLENKSSQAVACALKSFKQFMNYQKDSRATKVWNSKEEL